MTTLLTGLVCFGVGLILGHLSARWMARRLEPPLSEHWIRHHAYDRHGDRP